MRVSAIDIGTNSIRLLVAELNGGLKKILKTLETTRIGEGVDKTGCISEEAMDRSLRVLKNFKEISLGHDAEYIFAVGTSALRDAKNKEVFIRRTKEELGLQVEIIDGEREARLGFLGAVAQEENIRGQMLVLDIGGGSTEFIVGNKNEIDYSKSVDIGAVRLTERFIKHDPPLAEEVLDIEKYVDSVIEDVLKNILAYDIERIVGIGGTATSLGAVDLGLKVYDSNRVHRHILRYERIAEILNMFLSCDRLNRAQIPGLHPKRADIIVAGTIILKNIMEKLYKKDVIVSEWDNLEGLIMEKEGEILRKNGYSQLY